MAKQVIHLGARTTGRPVCGSRGTRTERSPQRVNCEACLATDEAEFHEVRATFRMLGARGSHVSADYWGDHTYSRPLTGAGANIEFAWAEFDLDHAGGHRRVRVALPLDELIVGLMSDEAIAVRVADLVHRADHQRRRQAALEGD